LLGVVVLMIVTYPGLVQVLKRRFDAVSGWHPAWDQRLTASELPRPRQKLERR
jgi:hypothetical protein